MTNPWQEWWEELTFEWMMLSSSVVQRQMAVLAAVLVLALILDRLLERHRTRWLGESPHEQYKIRSILWAAKFPLFVLVLGNLALSIYSATGWPTYTLRQLVTLFWFIAAYALVSRAVVVVMPACDARGTIRRVLLPLLALVGILHLTGLLAVLWKWASQPVINFASEKVTLASIWLGLAIVVGFWIAARGGKAVFLKAVLPRTEADPELAHSVAGFIQFAIIVAGCWLAIAFLGVEFSNLTLLISALTVGIGFGLQDVIKNVMGGVILLGEGHVRPNEVFHIGGKTGVVERIGIRSTTVRTWDGAQVIVPNADLIAEKVTDLSDSRRVQVSVGVSCDADPRLAEKLLLEIATAHAEVLSDPSPAVLFTNLGESTFDFTLCCFVDDRAKVARTQSDLHYAVVEAFRQHELEMPYRQLDVHLRSRSWGQVLPPPAA
jgi:small-conductance mechanosensitive channel